MRKVICDILIFVWNSISAFPNNHLQYINFLMLQNSVLASAEHTLMLQNFLLFESEIFSSYFQVFSF